MSSDRRLQVRLPVEICVQQFLADQTYLGLTRDLSEQGLYVTAPRMADTETWYGAPLQIEFVLPGTRETIWARGQICHEDPVDPHRGKGFGVRFLDMAERHAESLRRYVESVRRARLNNLLLKMQKGPKPLPGLVGLTLPS